MTTARLAKTRMLKATTELAVARSGIKHNLAPWRAAFDRRRSLWIVAGGFASGMALALLPPRVWSRIGAVAGGGAALLARSVLTPMIAGALVARKPQSVSVVAVQSAAAD